jgi:hypothetical protein
MKFFLAHEKVRDLTNPTVCSYRPAEILREKAPFQPPHRPGPNVKDKENREKTQREDQIERGINDHNKRTG